MNITSLFHLILKYLHLDFAPYCILNLSVRAESRTIKFERRPSGIFLIIFSTALFCLPAKSQDLLTLEDVIKLTIENNFDIQIAKNNEQIAKNNNNVGLIGGSQSTGGTPSGGNTGMLPQISIVAGSPQNPMGMGQTISTLKYANPAVDVNSQKLTTTSLAPSIVGTWYFFDGLKMFVTKKKLNRAEELSDLQYRLTLENTLLSALSSYYKMVSIQQLIKSLSTSLSLAEDQKKLAAQKLTVGNGSNVDVLQTQIDYNNIQVEIMQQKNLLNEQRISLNNILKRSHDVEFSVPDTIVIQTKPEYDAAIENADKNNNSILIGKKNIEIDELALKEFKANRMPKIGVTGNYSYMRTTNDIGFQRLNNSYGFNAGFIFSWTLLNNLTTYTAIKNQTIVLSSDNMRLEAIKMQEKSMLYKAYLNFKNNLDVIEIEKKSVGLASQNLAIAAQRFKLGLSNYIEYRTIEQSFEQAINRLSQASYNAKVSELNYLKQQGLLVH